MQTLLLVVFSALAVAQAPLRAPVPAPERAPARAPARVPTSAPTRAPTRAPEPGPRPSVLTTTNGSATGNDASGFIRVQGTSFVDEQCKDFLPTGWNTWQDPLIPQAIAAINGDARAAAQVESIFSQAANNSFNTMRFFLTGPKETQPFQQGPGQYDEQIFRAFDYIFDVARRYNVRLNLAMTSNWQLNDGPSAYTNWSGIPGQLDQFWTNPKARELFKNHIDAVTSRVNTVNGRVWKDDPTIFAWDLYNEMRCPQNQTETSATDIVRKCLADTNSWIDEMSTYLRQKDPNHLITVGNEGFFGPDSPFRADNPFGTPSNVNPGWAAYIGQDFVSQHNHTNIDFTTFHLWPDNWNSTDPSRALEWVGRWLRSHMQASRDLNKPLLLGEFGKRSFADVASQQSMRDPYFNVVYNVTENSINTNDVLRGALFWFWDPNYTTVVGEEGVDPLVPIPPSGNVVQNNGSTIELVRQHATRMDGLGRDVVPGCAIAGVVAG